MIKAKRSCKFICRINATMQNTTHRIKKNSKLQLPLDGRIMFIYKITKKIILFLLVMFSYIIQDFDDDYQCLKGRRV